MKKLYVSLVFIGAASVGGAQSFSLNDIVNWTGSGSNEAALLIDWQDGTTHPSLVWGYRWNGSATGEQMLQAVAAADPDLTIQITNYSFGDAVTALGFNGTAYGARGPGTHYASGFSTCSPGFWAYYLGSGPTLPVWSESATGAGGRSLADQAWDGWSWSANFVDTPPTNSPIAAPVPAPEPPSLLALAFAAAALRQRKK
ncbi:MAG: hypothetical protein ACYC96_10775 [Fimbriimonadaceae bacterium]